MVTDGPSSVSSCVTKEPLEGRVLEDGAAEKGLMIGEGECLVEQLREGLYLPGAISGPEPLAPVLMLVLCARSLVTALNEELAL